MARFLNRVELPYDTGAASGLSDRLRSRKGGRYHCDAGTTDGHGFDRTIHWQGGPKIRHWILLDERMVAKKIHLALTATLGDDAYGLSQIKVWLQGFRNDNCSAIDPQRGGQPSMALESQFEAFIRNILLQMPAELRSASLPPSRQSMRWAGGHVRTDAIEK
jgi:hypothetical protein